MRLKMFMKTDSGNLKQVAIKAQQARIYEIKNNNMQLGVLDSVEKFA